MQLKQLKGKTDHDIFPAELADSIAAADRIVIQSMKDSAYEDAFFVNDTMHHFVTTKFPIFDTAGRVYGVGCITTDITHLKLAENENRRLQEEIIRAQGETLRALSTPLLPIAPGVVVMPLIGNIDSNRAQRALETLLDGILKYQAAIVILDVTGVPIVDAHVASALVQTAQAVKLLGADVVLTGIQPKIARALIDLGIDLASIRTEGTLRGGIARALKG
jgi:anti-anti-sigma regulatory factor